MIEGISTLPSEHKPGPGRHASTWRPYDAWVAGQDREFARAAYSWWVVLLFLTVSEASLLACAYVPGPADLLELDFRSALLTQLPMLAWLGVMSVLRPLETMPPRRAYFYVLVSMVLISFWLGSLMGMSSTWGTLFFALFFLNGTAAQGYLFRSSVHQPLGVVGPLLGGMGAAALATTSMQTAVIALVTLTAMCTCLFLGTAARRQATARAQNEEMTAALHAQMLSERSIRVSQLQEMLETQLGYNHDLKNQLATLDGNLFYVREKLSPVGAPDELRGALEDMKDSLGRARTLLDSSRGAGKEYLQSVSNTVNVGPVLERVAAAQRWCFPAVDIRCEAPADTLHATVNGGEDNLHRVLTNVIANACQGDGQKHAEHVVVRARCNGPAGTVTLEVDDDGPGFSAQFLAGPVEGFKTTKKGGIGLGLYTCERLLWAGGGTMRRTNAPNGGALVEMTLLGPPKT